MFVKQNLAVVVWLRGINQSLQFWVFRALVLGVGLIFGHHNSLEQLLC